MHVKILFCQLWVCVCVSCLVVSDSVQPHRLQPTRPLCPWDSPGKNTGVGCHFLLQKELQKESEVAQSCPTLCNSMDCSPPGSSIHGIFQAGGLEWVPFLSPRSVVFLHLLTIFSRNWKWKWLYVLKELTITYKVENKDLFVFYSMSRPKRMAKII